MGILERLDFFLVTSRISTPPRTFCQLFFASLLRCFEKGGGSVDGVPLT